MKIEKHKQYIKSFPYYKVQYWGDNVVAWIDVQKAYPTQAVANKAGIELGKKYRLMKIYRDRREVL